MTFDTIISTEQLAPHLGRPNWVVFDCRFSLVDSAAGLAAYRREHIPEARYADLNRDLSSPVTLKSGRHPLPNFKLLVEKLGRWGVDNDSQVVVYDDASGAFAGRMWWLLRCLGHGRVAVLDGGIKQWRLEKRDLTDRSPNIAQKNYIPQRNDSLWLDAAQLQQGLDAKQIVLIDARSPERFRGEQEPIDRIAGHIPGALNRPFQFNLGENGLFLPPSELRKQFSELTGNTPGDRVVHMCGSGVTACHNLLAMEISGMTGSRLYAGSWSEWIEDGNRPVAAAKN
ncbi:MAG: sulfurtransferase [Gammaproteobacteria bacterium]